MATRTSMRSRLAGVGSQVWRMLAMVVLIGAALAVSTDHSHADAPVDVVITDTSFTLSWSADGEVKFYWWQPIARKLERVTVSDAKSWTATGLQPESEHEFSFFGAFYASLKFKTKASGDPPPPPPPPPTPEVSIAAGSNITEGGTASFTLTASPAPTSSINVSVSPSQSGNFGVGSTAKTVTIQTSGTTTVTFSTTNDSVDEADGSVTATIDSGAGYTVSSSKGSATLAVADDDVPELSIASDGNVTEGSAASFTITASPTPHAALTANVDITAAGSFGVTTGTRTVTIPTSGSQSFTVSTSGDTTDESNGSITATLSTGTGYTVSSSAGSASATVSDNDDPPAAKPVVSITAGSDITEGNDASFTVTVSPQQTGGLGVSLVVSESGAFISQIELQHILLMTERLTVTVSTGDDSTDEPDGTITATIRDLDTYTVSPTAGSATLAVADNDVPELSIASDGNVTEGSVASFTITASPTPHTALTANVDITATGSFGVTTGARTVTIPTSGSKAFTVSTSGDTTDEPDGSVSAALSTGTGYTVSSSAGSATATVADNDDPPVQSDTDTDTDIETDTDTDTESDTSSTTCDLPDDAITVDIVTGWRDALDPIKAVAGIKRWNRVLEALGVDTETGLSGMPADLAQNVADWLGNTRWDRTSRTLAAQEACDAEPSPQPLQQAIPEISITSGSDITEGGTVTFTLTATPAPTTDINVSVSVTESESFTQHGQTGNRTVTMTNTGTASFTVTTIDDSNDDFAGTITATVNSGTGYTVSSTAGSTYANVYDNDDPTVFVNAGSAITEGMDAVFKFQVSATQTKAIRVNLTVSQSGEFATTGPRTITITTSGIYHLIVPTTDDSTEESAGSVTVTINPGAGYTGAGSATVKVADSDKPLMGRALASSNCVSKSLKEKVRDYHYDNRKKPPDHGLNWWRVRTAFADAPGSKYPPYTAAEAIASEATWSGWTPCAGSAQMH